MTSNKPLTVTVVMCFSRVLFEGSAVEASRLVKSREILRKYDTYDTARTRTRRSSRV